MRIVAPDCELIFLACYDLGGVRVRLLFSNVTLPLDVEKAVVFGLILWQEKSFHDGPPLLIFITLHCERVANEHYGTRGCQTGPQAEFPRASVLVIKEFDGI